jgi:hypothetical protein
LEEGEEEFGVYLMQKSEKLTVEAKIEVVNHKNHEESVSFEVADTFSMDCQGWRWRNVFPKKNLSFFLMMNILTVNATFFRVEFQK